MKNLMNNAVNGVKNAMKSVMKKGTKKGTKKVKKGKRKMTDWNKLVQDVYRREKKNGKTFKECLGIAAKERAKMN